MMFTTTDGKVFGGGTPEAAVMDMCNAGILTVGKTIGEYMRSVSMRCEMLHGFDINHDSAEEFLRDLEAKGLITIGEVQ